MSVRKSLVWSYSSQFATFAVTFGTSVIVARLLSPRELGIFAMAVAVSGLVSFFTSFGVSNYVIREKEMPLDTLRASHTVNAGLAVLLASVLLGISFIAGLLDTDVAWVLRLTALGPLIGLFEFAPWAMTMREGRFGLFSSISMLRNICNALATVAFAHGGYGAASLALGTLVGAAASVLAYAFKRPGDMMLLPTFQKLRPIIVFGTQMVSIAGAAQVAQRLSDLLLGRFLGLAALGLYSRASNVSNQITNNVYGAASNVLFSKMSEELRTTGSLHHVYMRAVAVLTAVMWPLVIGVAVLARPFVAHVYGEKWLEAAAPLSLLMIAQFVILGTGMTWELFVLRGETARQARFEMVRAGVGAAVFAAGAAFSIKGAAIGRVVEAMFAYVIYRPHLDRLAGTTPGEIEGVFLRSAVLTAVAVTPSFLLMLWTGWSPQTDPLQMIVAVSLGAGLWLATLALQRHPLFEEAMRVVTRFRPVPAVRGN